MRRSENRPSPTPYERASLDYDLECESWARSLSEINLRSLASDYMIGKIDESTTDAYEEFLRRDRLNLLHDDKSAGLSRKSRKSRKGNRSRK